MAKKKQKENIHKVFIEDIMKKDYLEYAMSVIEERSIPDIRDGLKPVQRRILWTIKNTKEYTKSARHVGDCLGKYHPHGDCLKGDTVLYALDKSYRTIRELYKSGVKELEVLAYDVENDKYVPAIAHSFRIGQYTNKIYKITMKDGSYVECTSNHPFYDYLNKKWVKAEEVKAGMFLLNACINNDTIAIDELNKVFSVETNFALNEPMYDFTVDKYENALVLTEKNCVTDYGYKVIVAHNSSCYESLVRMSQDWKMYVPYVDGHGNFGSIDGDSAAAMRYCCTGDTLIKTIDYGTIPISKLAEGMEPNSDRVIDITVKSAFGVTNKADRVFHSGKHEIYHLVLENGMELRGTPNHPVLTYNNLKFDWVLLEKITRGTLVVIDTPEGLSAVKSITKLDKMEDVFSIRVCSDCHSFITNDIVSHNTEARISRDAIDLFFNFNQLGIEMKPNYDNKEIEPSFLTSPLPMLLVNGASGSAVGYSTNIPTHNPLEVGKAYIAFIEGKLRNDNIRKYIKGPDHPIGCKIIDKGGIDRAYETGRGSYYCIMDYTIEQGSYGRQIIRFNNVLPNVNKTNIIEAIASNVRNNGVLAGLISDLSDESNMDEISIAITLKKGIDPKVAVEALVNERIVYKNFGITSTCIVDGRPMVIGIIDFFRYFHAYQKEISTNHLKRTNEKLGVRLHVLDGIAYAIKNYEIVLDIIKKSKSRQDAIDKLKNKFKKLDDTQVKAILDTKLSSLVNKGHEIIDEQASINKEIESNKENIENIDAYIISNVKFILASLKGYKRRCEIVKEVN